ncbi:DUF1194 domain-containing protein [Plastoroseomonas arctica]|uniref:DUF1194 domain-containing protein n=1 Tax=Plastoroseomonas arctica TaxID=1509237 RepID=A0AAF1K9A4_9PROT|nr:DUF1194 domain-containing protein [Plastoroseomonas arctica]MBR0657516.1 DUF1194 domain-containing protein [Plastoroseomonas arctica]
MEPVDLALVLAVDASSSVDFDEFGLMMGGYAAAFRDAEVQAAMVSGTAGAVSVTLMLWSNIGAQAVGVPWLRVAGAADAGALSAAVEACPRLVPAGATALGEAMAAGFALLGAYRGAFTRGVMDVSGDGAWNQGRSPGPVRDIGVAAGFVVNGLAVLNEEPDLLAHYVEEVIGGPGSFAMPTADYASFAEAIRRKLLREIGGAMVA